MQVNLDLNKRCLNKRCNTSFGMSYRMTDSAKKLMQTRKMSEKNIDKFQKILKNFNDLKKVEVSIDNIDGILQANIFCAGRYAKAYYESFFSSLFKSPVKFLEKINNKAKAADEMLLKQDKIFNIIEHNRI